ncbi:RiPP maturation radical SAM C-methyltransferase [Thermogutta sp.]|uniref:RiPP maturation radical SAM C-methyltransferase n=1 Tax=Thermogutta sp. TaxID=1962930 RepID=UPI00321F6F98
MDQTREVVLVNMPFANLRWPNLGLSLLKAAVQRKGIPCRILYLNYDFAEQIGYDVYQWIADHFAFTLGGERLFSRHYFGRFPTSNREYVEEVLRAADPHFSERDELEFTRLTAEAKTFLEKAAAAYPWQQALVVGFATTFQQTMPSLALAKRIKAICPSVTIVFGGAACEGEMGTALAEQFPEIDYVFLGEADYTFPEFILRLQAGQLDGALPPGVISGKAVRGSAKPQDDSAAFSALIRLPVMNGSRPDFAPVSVLVEDLENLPYPDFDDFFARYEASDLNGLFEPVLFFEMSRGCWWGQKHHCAFCGLNGQSMRYRSKSAQRILAELKFLTQRYPATQGCAADNILDFRAFDSLLPQLEAAQLPFHFACELKANLTRQQVGQLLRAGLGAAQLGIETFDSDLLKRIDKGALGVQNLQTLKWFTEAGIEVEWNWLYGFPGETPLTYERLVQLVPQIVHLAPPLGVGRVRMDRFSPFVQHPERFGMIRPRPSRAFRHVYPFSEEILNRLAYYFEFDFAEGLNPDIEGRRLVTAISRWREDHTSARLTMHRDEDGTLLITDTRPTFGFRQHRLRGWEAALYLFCDAARGPGAIRDWLASRPAIASKACYDALERWQRDGILLRWDDRFLALAIWVPEQSELYQAARNVKARIEQHWAERRAHI